MKQKYILEKLSTALFYASILIFLISFNFQDSKSGGWYLQYIPVGNQINDVTFLDSLIGFLITGDFNGPSTINYILKTTNSGNNWQIIYTGNKVYTRIKFVNSQTGFVCGAYNDYPNCLLKTTNQGNNWFALNTPSSYMFKDMSVLNEDTIWLASDDFLEGGLYRTTNGGQTWIQQFYQYNNNPDIIYMYNRNLGFMRSGDPPFSAYIGRTTNSGFNWTITNEDTAFTDIHFIDSLNGYMSGLKNIKKTTNGGINWVYQYLPNVNGSIFNLKLMESFCFVNKDTAFGVGGWFDYPNNQARGIVYKTTNGGNNWGYQIPDTSYNLFALIYVDFIDKYKGWAVRYVDQEIHTTIGGSDTTFYTSVNKTETILTKEFILNQNFPNPFNATTNIKYKLEKTASIRIVIFDITGKEIMTPVNKKQNSGEYFLKFDGSSLSSGVYFYTLFADGNRMDSKKMMLLK
jgi:photosystem II stability/assembly factor-like uncharacterized protein